jgi:hypothetical protein
MRFLTFANSSQAFMFAYSHSACFPSTLLQKARSHTRAFFAFWDWRFGLAQNVVLAYGAGPPPCTQF